MPLSTKGYAAPSATKPMEPFEFERRDVGANDVHLKIKYCGVCHSDLHQVRDEWQGATFPLVPGHEIVGIVEAVGKDVTKFKKGDIGAVGCFVDSCSKCDQCKIGDEQHCPTHVQTYASVGYDKKPTQGGYSRDIVVRDHFVCKVPDSLKDQLAAVAPLLCAGITTWTPMKRHGMDKPGKKIGVVGLGGLGHMAVKFGVAFGNEVTVISSSDKKKDEAMKVFGCKNFVVSTDKKDMEKNAGTLDFIIDTVSARKDINSYISLLGVGGILVTVAAPPVDVTLDIQPFALIFQRNGLFGSLVGGMKETQEMLDYCGQKNITSMVEVILMDGIENAFLRMAKSDVRYRFVIDMDRSSI